MDCAPPPQPSPQSPEVSQTSCGPPPSNNQNQGIIDNHKNPVAALIGPMQQNWNHSNNAANDEFVVQICQYIRQQQTGSP